MNYSKRSKILVVVANTAFWISIGVLVGDLIVGDPRNFWIKVAALLFIAILECRYGCGSRDGRA